MKQCGLKGCGKRIKNTLLMCAEHWALVPMELQIRVWEKARTYQNIDPFSPNFNEVRQEYYEVAREAIKIVWIKVNGSGV